MGKNSPPKPVKQVRLGLVYRMPTLAMPATRQNPAPLDVSMESDLLTSLVLHGLMHYLLQFTVYLTQKCNHLPHNMIRKISAFSLFCPLSITCMLAPCYPGQIPASIQCPSPSGHLEGLHFPSPLKLGKGTQLIPISECHLCENT